MAKLRPSSELLEQESQKEILVFCVFFYFAFVIDTYGAVLIQFVVSEHKCSN